MRRSLPFTALLFFICFSNLLFSQAGTYYNSISVSSPTFISDLEARIRSPYTRISYDQFDETNVASFASRDTLIGKKVITCVYSGENYIYTPPFTWGHYSREHSWCQSWMPSAAAADFSNRPEYSDQHHLFPSNQDNANGIRSNYAEGNVVTVTSTYLQCKFGKDASGRTVFEPRASHKGDFARALLYMALRYDGIDGYRWLIPQTPQDLATLLEWNRQDPPDKWEIDRNNYIQSVQQNRNPFVDHPEYVNYINFNDLSLQSPSLAKEPENQLSNLSGSTVTDSSITISWTDAAAGSQTPSGYLILVYSKDNYFIPMDGVTYSDDTDLTDGKAVINVPYSAADSYVFKKLKSASDYYFTVYSYNGTASQINYNTNGSGVKAKIRTSGLSVPKVFFSSAAATVLRKNTSYSINVSISDPSPDKATSVQVVLSSGSGALINNFSSATVTFPAGSTTPQVVPITITASPITGDEILTFTLKNVTGGNDVQFVSPDKFELTVSTGGLEDFSTYPVMGSSYVSGTFKGQDGSTWTYSSCANANPITTPSPVLKKNASPLAKVESGVIQGGCGVISFKYMQPFSTNVNLGLYVNNTLYGTVTTNAETGIVKNSGPITVNVKGDFTIKLEQINSTSAQVTIDDITWTSYGLNTAVDNETVRVPEDFSLYQNYPNPFNPETTIKYDLPKDEYVTIKVFNALGKETAVLLNGSFSSAGSHQVIWNASGFPSGIYFLRMQAGEFSSMRKLILMK